MNKWNIELTERCGQNKESFSVVVEAETKIVAAKKVLNEYKNTELKSITLSEDGMDVHSLYECLKGVSPVNEERNEDEEESYLDSVDLFADELKKVLSPEDYAKLSRLMKEQDGYVDRPYEASKAITKWYDNTGLHDLEDFVQSEKDLVEMIEEQGTKEEREELFPIVQKIIAILDTIDTEDKEDIDEGGEVVEQQGQKPNKETLYLCNECAKTFRSKQNVCPTCKTVSEKVLKEEKEKKEELKTKKDAKDGTVSSEENVEGQEKLAPEVEVDEGGEIEDKKLKNEAIDSEKGVRNVVAKGIVDKLEADKIASGKKGQVVADDEDPKKFMVIVKEAINEKWNDDDFEAVADLSVHLSDKSGNYDVEHDRSVRVPFKLDIEYRQWGIGSITASVVKPVKLVCTVVDISGDEDVRKDIDVTIDPDKIKTEKNPTDSYGITIGELDVTMTLEGQVTNAVAYVDYGK